MNKVYDPACGSGSLLLKFAKVLGQDNVRQGFFGQEINLTTYNLCRINMFLHDINYEKFDIAHGDTLTDPQHWDDEPFEAIVSNPPYSIKWEGDANPLLINDPRFAPAGVLAPKSKADLAFTMHMLSWLAVNGTAAIVEFPGVLYRGGAEQKIRKYLDRQQLRRHGDPAAARPLLRHHDRDLHHRAQEVQDRQRGAVHRRLRRVRPRTATRTSSPRRTSRGSSTRSPRATDVDHFAEARRRTPTSPRTATTSRSPPTSRPRTPARPSTSRRSTPRSRGSSRGRASCGAQIDAIVADLEGGHVSRIDDLIAEMCPDGVEFRPLGDVGQSNVATRRRSETSRTGDGTIPASDYGETIQTRRRRKTTAFSVSA